MEKVNFSLKGGNIGSQPLTIGLKIILYKYQVINLMQLNTGNWTEEKV